MLFFFGELEISSLLIMSYKLLILKVGYTVNVKH